MSTKELVIRAVGGDKDVFCRLVERYQGRVRAHIAGFVVNSETVCDLAQDTFLEAYRALGRFDPARDLGAWLNGIARNCTLRHLRAESKRKSRERDLLSEAVRK